MNLEQAMKAALSAMRYAGLKFAMPLGSAKDLTNQALVYLKVATSKVPGLEPQDVERAAEAACASRTEFPTAAEFAGLCEASERQKWVTVCAKVPGDTMVVVEKVRKDAPAHEVERVQRELEGRAAQLALPVHEKPESEGDGYQRYLEAGRNVKAKIMRPSNSSVRKMQEENLDEKKRLMRAKLEESEVKE